MGGACRLGGMVRCLLPLGGQALGALGWGVDLWWRGSRGSKLAARVGGDLSVIL